MLLREQGRVHALVDRCPHRGIPLRVGRQEFPGTWSCRYHGWTFDIATGTLVGALPTAPTRRFAVRCASRPFRSRSAPRPDSGCLRATSHPPPVESQIPEQLLAPDTVVAGRITVQKGSWRNACENGIDLGHAWMLHRWGALWTFFDGGKTRRTRATTTVDEQGWMTSKHEELHWTAEYPGLGHWPHPRRRARRSYRVNVDNRLPGAIPRLQRIGKPYLHLDLVGADGPRPATGWSSATFNPHGHRGTVVPADLPSLLEAPPPRRVQWPGCLDGRAPAAELAGAPVPTRQGTHDLAQALRGCAGAQ